MRHRSDPVEGEGDGIPPMGCDPESSTTEVGPAIERACIQWVPIDACPTHPMPPETEAEGPLHGQCI